MQKPYLITILDTIRKNKREKNPENLLINSKRSVSSVFDFGQKKTLVLFYVPKKVLLLLSTLHDKAEVCENTTGTTIKSKIELIHLINVL